jgi:uncharacterized cupredoxin-like copper-binding protein
MKQVIKAVLLGPFSTAVIASGSHDHSHGPTEYAVGEPGKGEPDRIIAVSMQDSMRFDFNPQLDEITTGETIEFRVTNDGQVQHEFSIGNAKEQIRHAQMMQKMPNMKHDDPNTVSLAPGESARISWKFFGNDEVVFACNIPGHFEAGMKHTRQIEAGSKAPVTAN